MKYLRQSTVATVIVGPFVAVADGVTPKTALADQSTNGRIQKNGTGSAVTLSSWAHDALGHYAVGLSTAHTDTIGRFRLEFSDPATFLPVWEDFSVLAAAVYDVLFGSTALSTLGGTAQTGDVFARVGAAGAGLTALGDARIANLDAAVSSRSTFAGGAVASVTADVGITQAGADKVWGTTTRSLTDKIGFALSVAGVQAIWDAATSALTTAGSIGKRLVDFITTLVYAAPSTPPTAVQIRQEIDSNSTAMAEANTDLDEIITSLAAIQTITWPLVAVTGTPTSTSVQVTGLTETTANAYRDGYFLLQTGTHEFTVPSPISASSYSGGTTTLTFATALVVVPSAGDAALIIGSKRSS